MPDGMTSPCGSNCSFHLSLDVPYFTCNNTTSNTTIEDTTGPPVFTAQWSGFILNATTYSVDLSSLSESDTESQSSFPARAFNIICSPSRADYSLDIVYENNVQSMGISVGAVTALNLQSPAPDPTANNGSISAKFPGFMGQAPDNGGSFFGVETLDWTSPYVSWYRDLQIMALIDSMASSLVGDVLADPFEPAAEITENGTVVSNTRFHKTYGIYTPTDPPTLTNMQVAGQNIPNETSPYTVSQELLNQALLNITLSVIADYGLWETHGTPIQQQKTINVYSFSTPLSLILPYFISLCLALPFLAIGVFALQHNGVAAVDGGFIQLITTSTGSATLERLAAGGCLGGGENAPKELKELKIRFGELVGEGKGGSIRRAGFGTEAETVPLNKGQTYGSRNDFMLSFI